MSENEKVFLNVFENIASVIQSSVESFRDIAEDIKAQIKLSNDTISRSSRSSKSAGKDGGGFSVGKTFKAAASPGGWAASIGSFFGTRTGIKGPGGGGGTASGGGGDSGGGGGGGSLGSNLAAPFKGLKGAGGRLKSSFKTAGTIAAAAAGVSAAALGHVWGAKVAEKSAKLANGFYDPMATSKQKDLASFRGKTARKKTLASAWKFVPVIGGTISQSKQVDISIARETLDVLKAINAKNTMDSAAEAASYVTDLVKFNYMSAEQGADIFANLNTGIRAGKKRVNLMKLKGVKKILEMDGASALEISIAEGNIQKFLEDTAQVK